MSAFFSPLWVFAHPFPWPFRNDSVTRWGGWFGKKYTLGPRYWYIPVLVNTGTFLVYQYWLKMWYLRSLERAGVIQKLTILEHKNGLVLSNTRVPVSGTWSILFPNILCKCYHCHYRWEIIWHSTKEYFIIWCHNFLSFLRMTWHPCTGHRKEDTVTRSGH